jgi:hypothetical protein
MREIDEARYCIASLYQKGMDVLNNCDAPMLSPQRYVNHQSCIKDECYLCHRKYETPEQYENRTDEKLGDDVPVWVMQYSGQWKLETYYFYRIYNDKNIEAVIATIWGKPPENWKPEAGE